MNRRLAGVLYLVPTVLGPFSLMAVPNLVVEVVNGVRTSRVLEHETLFRLGIGSDLIIVAVELALTGALFQLLAPAGRTLSLTAAFARLAMTVLQAANVVLSIAALMQPARALEWLDLHQAAMHVWEVPFGLHLVLLGALVRHREGMPKVFSPMLAMAGLGYALNGFVSLVVPSAAPVVGGIVVVTSIAGELPFALWLLIKGSPADES